ncbi:MAG: 2-oxoacid:acceptor oxidoreductase subunit alpha, partial [Desulfomonilaceae bacterium]
MNSNSINVLIAGEAGQGLVTLSQILTKGLVRAGYFIVVTQSYQSRIRGGHNSYAIRISDRQIIAPTESVDLLLALDKNSVKIHQHELSENGLVIVDSRVSVDQHPKIIQVPFAKLSDDKFSNSVALGLVTVLLGLDKSTIGVTLRDFFDRHGPDAVDHNFKSFSAGYEWGFQSNFAFPKLAAVSSKNNLTLNGNEAIALGAIMAGLRFFSFYPMTPATSIANTLVDHASYCELIIEQGEDEISAINMAVGASFAGAPSMVATSGGGFALMTETVSLAGMTETPVVIVVAQRPGPSTGLPTRTEQGDLEFVLHSGHGEFPRAIFAPGDVEQAFDLTRKAFQTAQRYNTPVFILTDQFLADSYRSVTPFDVHEIAPIQPCLSSSVSANPHLTFLLTDTGVSPRIFPGLSSQCVKASSIQDLVIADSDEHTQDGHLTEDLSVRTAMVEKRLGKIRGMQFDSIRPEFVDDPEPELLFVCWGSTRGSSIEAADQLRTNGKRVAALHFSQVWPIVPEKLIEVLESAKNVVGVES